jgi:hypothetical protein
MIPTSLRISWFVLIDQNTILTQRKIGQQHQGYWIASFSLHPTQFIP